MNKGKGNIGVVFLLVVCILVLCVVIGMLYFTRTAVEEENLQNVYGIVLWGGIVILALTFITLFTYLGVNNKQDAKARQKKKSKKQQDDYLPYREPARRSSQQQPYQPYQAPSQQQSAPYQAQPNNVAPSKKEQEELARQQAKLAKKQKQNRRQSAAEAPQQPRQNSEQFRAQPQVQQQPYQAQQQPYQAPRQPQPQMQQRQTAPYDPQPQAQPQVQQQPRQPQPFAGAAPQSEATYSAQPVNAGGRTQSIEEKFNEIGKMGKAQFVVYMAKLFKLKGYQIMLTPVANNHGIDILLEKMNVKTAVSCVLSDKILTDTEVHKAEDGKGFYNCERAMVVTNTYFDRMALAASKEKNTALVDRNILAEDFMR